MSDSSVSAAGKAKVLVVGFDSAEPNLLEQWMDEGLLPNLKSLSERGLAGRLDVCDAMGDGNFWPTLYTGVGIGRHGRIFFKHADPQTYRDVGFNDDTDLMFPPFWRALSDSGKSVAVIDVFRAPLTPNINGIQIADWGVHGWAPHNRTRTWPPSLVDYVLARYGADPFAGSIEDYLVKQSDIRGAVDILNSRIKKKVELCRELLDQRRWDMFYVVFGEPHDIGHVAWHCHDPLHPKFDKLYAERNGDPVKAVAVALDAALGELIAYAAPSYVVVLAGLGMEAGGTANYVLDKILSRLDTASTSPLVRAIEKQVSRVLGGADRFRGKSQSKNEPLSRAEIRAKGKCFAVAYNEHAGAVRFNIIGREACGKIRSGEECERYFEWLSRGLLGIVNSATGQPIVRRIYRARDFAAGECSDRLPDFYVVWNRVPVFTEIESPLIGKMSVPYPRRTGDHTRNASVVIAGGRIPTGPSQRKIAPEDIAPTISCLLGVPLPKVDGRAIPEVLAKSDRPETTGVEG